MVDEAAAQATAQPNAQSSSGPASQAAPASTSTSATTSAQPTAKSEPSPSTTAAAKPERPAWAPESYWDADGGRVKAEFGDHYKDLATFKATEDSRRLTLPKTPEGYQAQLPKDFQAPQGVEFKIDNNNPIWSQARQLMHDIDTGKVSGQAAFEKMIALHAANEISTVQNLKTARDAEVSKLGPAGSARVTAVQSFLNAQLGEPLGGFMGNMLVTAQHVEGFEKLMASFRNQGAGTFSPSRAPSEPAKISPEQYNKMTYTEKLEYARAHNGGARPN